MSRAVFTLSLRLRLVGALTAGAGLIAIMAAVDGRARAPRPPRVVARFGSSLRWIALPVTGGYLRSTLRPHTDSNSDTASLG